MYCNTIDSTAPFPGLKSSHVITYINLHNNYYEWTICVALSAQQAPPARFKVSCLVL